VSAKLCGIEQSAPPMFGTAAITLGIDPHSSLIIDYYYYNRLMAFFPEQLG